ncbi:MAG: hypothetical protein WCO12_01365 [bacterium]
MRSIKASYKAVQDKNPHLGDYLCLAKAVRGKKYSRKNLVKAFKDLIANEDYIKNETKELVSYLEYLTNTPEEVEN